MKRMNRLGRAVLLFGMALLIPAWLFTAGNVLFAPWPLYGRSRLALCLLTPVCLALLLLLVQLSAPLARRLEKGDRRILLLCLPAFFAVQVLLSLSLRHIPITDQEQCLTAAALLCDTGAFETSERASIYFSRYPFNLGFVYLLAGLFRLCGALGLADRYMQVAVLSALFFGAGFAASARLARRLGGARAEALLLLLFPCTLPFFYCTAELYTDVFALAFPPVILLFFANARDAKGARARLLWSLLFALAVFAGWQIRVTTAIAAIACALQALFERRFRLLLAAGVTTAAVLLPGCLAVERVNARHLGAENLAQHRLSVWHYLAMGLPIHEDEGYGQYGSGGWLIFSTSFDDPAERDAALRREVRDRVYYLRYPARLLNMLSRKNLSSFGEGTFQLNAAIEGDHKAPDNAVKQIIFSRGRFRGAYRHLCTAMLAAQLLLSAAACFRQIRLRRTRGAAVFVTLVGAFCYLCLWETNARYFFMFQMALLVSCALIFSSAAGSADE